MLRAMSGELDPTAVLPLKGMAERGAVLLGEDIGANLHPIVGVHGQNERVEGAMVDGAHGEAVRHDGESSPDVLPDVSGIEERPMAQPTQ